MAADRQPKMRAMIMADDEEDRRAALDELLPLQQEDFEGLFEAMAGLPVTIRLLDPPLHEFLPDAEEVAQELERARIEQHRRPRGARADARAGPRSWRRPTRCSARAACGSAMLHPEIYEMQVRAIVARPRAVERADRRGAAARDHDPARRLRAGARADARADRARRRARRATATRRSIGTMIELPRACFVADRIAEHADFFSFGTNDLTQTALGFSRDDVEGRFLARYIERKDRRPQPVRDDRQARRRLAGARWRRGSGREAKPDLKLGICGEHGGDPDSIEFFHMAGLDYVSCSPYRVPIARVAAAQAAHSLKDAAASRAYHRALMRRRLALAACLGACRRSRASALGPRGAPSYYPNFTS